MSGVQQMLTSILDLEFLRLKLYPISFIKTLHAHKAAF